MEIFNNQQRSGYDEIVSYGPKWWTDYREMDANYKFAGWTLDLMAFWLEQIIKNQFATTADERTIIMLEKLLGIESGNEPLDERRRTVNAYFSGFGKLNRSSIKATIKTYTGCDSDIVWAGNVLHVNIIDSGEYEYQIEKVYAMLSKRMPAHIGLEISISNPVTAAKVYAATAMSGMSIENTAIAYNY